MGGPSDFLGGRELVSVRMFSLLICKVFRLLQEFISKSFNTLLKSQMVCP